MEITEFAEITQRVIRKDGFADFIPTLLLPSKREIVALDGVPKEKESDIRRIAIRWAEGKAEQAEEFLLAFKDDPEHFRIIRRFEGQDEEQVFRVE